MKNCSKICKAEMNLEECIGDELSAWDTKDKMLLLKNCKIILREEFKDCINICLSESPEDLGEKYMVMGVCKDVEGNS